VEALSILERLRREVITASYLVQLTTIEIPCGVAMVLSGDYAGGVADLENTLARFSAWRNKRMLASGHLALGEVYLSLATSGKSPAPEMLRQNASFAAPAIPSVEGRALRHLEEAVRYASEADTPGLLAQGLADLGLLSKWGGQLAPAREFFEQARAIAEELGAKTLVSRIDAAF
jgi:hypothetical protein